MRILIFLVLLSLNTFQAALDNNYSDLQEKQ